MTETNVPAQASDEPMRDKFELWALSEGWTRYEIGARQNDGYSLVTLQNAWYVWQAAAKAATRRATADVERDPPVPVTILRAALKNAALGQSSYGTNYDGNKLGRAIEILIATKGAKP